MSKRVCIKLKQVSLGSYPVKPDEEIITQITAYSRHPRTAKYVFKAGNQFNIRHNWAFKGHPAITKVVISFHHKKFWKGNPLIGNFVIEVDNLEPNTVTSITSPLSTPYNLTFPSHVCIDVHRNDAEKLPFDAPHGVLRQNVSKKIDS